MPLPLLWRPEVPRSLCMVPCSTWSHVRFKLLYCNASVACKELKKKKHSSAYLTSGVNILLCAVTADLKRIFSDARLAFWEYCVTQYPLYYTYVEMTSVALSLNGRVSFQSNLNFYGLYL